MSSHQQQAESETAGDLRAIATMPRNSHHGTVLTVLFHYDVCCLSPTGPALLNFTVSMQVQKKTLCTWGPMPSVVSGVHWGGGNTPPPQLRGSDCNIFTTRPGLRALQPASLFSCLVSLLEKITDSLMVRGTEWFLGFLPNLTSQAVRRGCGVILFITYNCQCFTHSRDEEGTLDQG